MLRVLTAAELVICFWAFVMDKTGKHYTFKEGGRLYIMFLGVGDIEKYLLNGERTLRLKNKTGNSKCDYEVSCGKLTYRENQAEVLMAKLHASMRGTGEGLPWWSSG